MSILQGRHVAVVIASSMLPLVLDTEEWASGIWAGAENANVVFSRSSNVQESLVPLFQVVSAVSTITNLILINFLRLQ